MTTIIAPKNEGTYCKYASILLNKFANIYTNIEKMGRERLIALYIGPEGKTGKMPCNSWSISAFLCKNSCPQCYALQNHYIMTSTQDALNERLVCYINSLNLDKNNWESAMVKYVSKFAKKDIWAEKIGQPGFENRAAKYFRWFDSGDLLNLEMLEKIENIATRVPEVKFWLPTQRFDLLDEYNKKYGIEKLKAVNNLTVRTSGADKYGLPTSFITENKETATLCPASNQDTTEELGYKCPPSCRKCWDKEVKRIDYLRHGIIINREKNNSIRCRMLTLLEKHFIDKEVEIPSQIQDQITAAQNTENSQYIKEEQIVPEEKDPNAVVPNAVVPSAVVPNAVADKPDDVVDKLKRTEPIKIVKKPIKFNRKARHSW